MPQGKRVKQVVVGQGHQACALSEDDELRCWGPQFSHYPYKLMSPDTPPLQLRMDGQPVTPKYLGVSTSTRVIGVHPRTEYLITFCMLTADLRTGCINPGLDAFIYGSVPCGEVLKTSIEAQAPIAVISAISPPSLPPLWPPSTCWDMAAVPWSGPDPLATALPVNGPPSLPSQSLPPPTTSNASKPSSPSVGPAPAPAVQSPSALTPPPPSSAPPPPQSQSQQPRTPPPPPLPAPARGNLSAAALPGSPAEAAALLDPSLAWAPTSVRQGVTLSDTGVFALTPQPAAQGLPGAAGGGSLGAGGAGAAAGASSAQNLRLSSAQWLYVLLGVLGEARALRGCTNGVLRV